MFIYFHLFALYSILFIFNLMDLHTRSLFVTKVMCMQVTKQEVHRIWAGLKERLYTQDVTWIKKQVDSVVSYTTRLLSLHQRDNFLTHFQAVDLQVGK